MIPRTPLRIGDDLNSIIQILHANIALDNTALEDLNVKAPPYASLPNKDQGAD